MADIDVTSPIYGPFFGAMGAASAMIFSGNYFTRRGIGSLHLLCFVHPLPYEHIWDALAKFIDFIFFYRISSHIQHKYQKLSFKT